MRPTSTRAKLEALKAGKELPVQQLDLWAGTAVGDVPSTDVRAVLRLAGAYHRAESDDVAISWAAQERARLFFNTHGLIATLDEAEVWEDEPPL